MSRSVKKHPIIKDGCKSDRQIHHRRFRSVNKQRVRQGLEPLLSKEVTNSYDICDYVISLYTWDLDEQWYYSCEKIYTEQEKKEITRKYYSK